MNKRNLLKLRYENWRDQKVFTGSTTQKDSRVTLA